MSWTRLYLCRFGVQPRDSLPYDVFLQKIEGTDPGQVLPIKPSHRYIMITSKDPYDQLGKLDK